MSQPSRTHNSPMFFILLCSREADDIKEQIDKKCQALSVADPGSDLLSVQALQRQHEVFERDIIPLGEKVRCVFLIFLNTFFKLMPVAMCLSLVLLTNPLFLDTFLYLALY